MHWEKATLEDTSSSFELPSALVTARERSLDKQISKLSKLADELRTRFPEDAPRVSSIESTISSMPLSAYQDGYIDPTNREPQSEGTLTYVFINQ